MHVCLCLVKFLRWRKKMKRRLWWLQRQSFRLTHIMAIPLPVSAASDPLVMPQTDVCAPLTFLLSFVPPLTHGLFVAFGFLFQQCVVGHYQGDPDQISAHGWWSPVPAGTGLIYELQHFLACDTPWPAPLPAGHFYLYNHYIKVYISIYVWLRPRFVPVNT